MQESRLYLIFEFLSMDLKKYLDSIPSDQEMDSMLVKVCLELTAFNASFVEPVTVCHS